MDAAVGISLLVGIPVLFAVLSFRGGRWRPIVTAAFILWSALIALFFVAVYTAEDLDPLCILALAPLLTSAIATIAASWLGAGVKGAIRAHRQQSDGSEP